MQHGATAALIALGGIAACTSPAPPAGLEILISTDMSFPKDYNAIRVEVSQQNAVGGWTQLFNTSFAVPTDATLPSTVAVAPGPSADQEALIKITAYRGFQDDSNPGTVQVVREAQLQIPETRIAQLDLELSKACIDVSCTNPNESCQPSGKCGSDEVDSESLPTYVPVDGGAVCEGANCDVSTSDSGAEDAASRDAGGKDDATPQVDAGADTGPMPGQDAGGDSGSSEHPDGGQDARTDGGKDAAPDVGPHDSGVDAPRDSGSPPVDSGIPHDTGSQQDSSDATSDAHDSGGDAHDSGSDGPKTLEAGAGLGVGAMPP
jgi:hypothetical protein